METIEIMQEVYRKLADKMDLIEKKLDEIRSLHQHQVPPG